MSKKIEVLSREVRLTGVNDQDYVCLTEIARYKDPERTDYLIFNWLRNPQHHRVPRPLGADQQPRSWKKSHAETRRARRFWKGSRLSCENIFLRALRASA